MRRRSILPVMCLRAVVSAACVFSGGLVLAQAPAATGGPTVVPENKDADFAIVGEFVGPVETSPRKYEPLAIQVRSMGGGSFEAVQYAGGLPGEKGHRKQLTSLLGKRSGSFLVLSGGPWAVLVHRDHAIVVSADGNRIGRLERIVRGSPTMGAKPPKDAIVIFDGKNTDSFSKATMTEDGLLMQGADFKPMFQDFNMHLEFLLPYKPGGRGQDRGNSGVYLQSRYEVQILDSFAEPPTYNGLGALYRYREPDLNMSLPPSTWQTYDLLFTAPRWAAGGEKIRNARITVWLNGVKVHNDIELKNKTGAGKAEEPLLLPTRLQDHGNPVRFRNIWVIDRGLSAGTSFPVYPPKPAPPKEDKPQESKQQKPAPAKPADKPQASKQQKSAPVKPADKPRTNDAKPGEPKSAQPSPPKGNQPEAKDRKVENAAKPKPESAKAD